MENMALAFSGSQEKARSFPVPESSEWEVAEKDALAIDTSGGQRDEYHTDNQANYARVSLHPSYSALGGLKPWGWGGDSLFASVNT